MTAPYLSRSLSRFLVSLLSVLASSSLLGLIKEGKSKF